MRRPMHKGSAARDGKPQVSTVSPMPNTASKSMEVERASTPKLGTAGSSGPMPSPNISERQVAAAAAPANCDGTWHA
jgi:hypothetical protein